MNNMNQITRLFYREFLLYVRNRHELLNPLIFFVIVVSLFPLATSPQLKLLTQIGPGIIWVAALLALQLSLPKLFQEDYRDGSLEQMMLLPIPLPLLCVIKAVSHWVANILPLILISPLLAEMYHLQWYTTWSSKLTWWNKG